MDLKDFFSAAEAKSDRWCEMNAVGRKSDEWQGNSKTRQGFTQHGKFLTSAT